MGCLIGEIQGLPLLIQPEQQERLQLTGHDLDSLLIAGRAVLGLGQSFDLADKPMNNCLLCDRYLLIKCTSCCGYGKLMPSWSKRFLIASVKPK